MAERLGARKNSSWNAICTAPDFCKTPMGPNVIPIPYMIIAYLSQSDNTVPNVRFNGDPCKVLDQSIVPRCTGDEPGTAGGVRSGTVSDEVKPVSACPNVRAGGKQVVRELDPCTMNRGNCSHALYFTQPAPGSCFTAGGTPAPNANLPAEPTPAEKEGFLKKWLNRTKSDLGLAAEHPGEAAKGAIKGQVNMVPELGEMMAQGSALQHAAEMEERAALMRMFGSSRAADQMQASAEALRQSADQITFPKLDMSHPAAPAGDRLFTLAQFVLGGAGLLKSGATAGIRALTKSVGRAAAGEVDDAARILAKGSAKAADTVSDAAKAEKVIVKEVRQVEKIGDATATTAAERGGVKVRKSKAKKPNEPKPRQPRNYEKKVVNEDGSVTYTLKNEKGELVEVTYKNGYPDFSSAKYDGKLGKAEVEIEMTGKNKVDFARANKKAGFGKGTYDHPDGYTWHHHQDGKTMQLVKTDVHGAAPHTGGASAARIKSGGP